LVQINKERTPQKSKVSENGRRDSNREFSSNLSQEEKISIEDGTG